MIKMIENIINCWPLLLFLFIINVGAVIWAVFHGVSLESSGTITSVNGLIAGACFCRLMYMAGNAIADMMPDVKKGDNDKND